MNITLSTDERIARQARRVAETMGKSLNQIIREHLEELASTSDNTAWCSELRNLSTEGNGRSRGWRFNREEIHERP